MTPSWRLKTEGGAASWKAKECLRKAVGAARVAYVASAGGIFAVTGAAKAFGAFGQAKMLHLRDPILGLRFGHLMLGLAVAELTIASVCLFSGRRKLSLVLVAWMSTNFAVYRVGLWLIGWHHPCACLGNLTDALHISADTGESLVKMLLTYLLIGSYLMLCVPDPNPSGRPAGLEPKS